MDKIICDNYVAILKNELIASFGCTEPIVIAYASAKAREVLGEDVVKLELLCSGNVIKNVKSVIVPNSDGERGIPSSWRCSPPSRRRKFFRPRPSWLPESAPMT